MATFRKKTTRYVKKQVKRAGKYLKKRYVKPRGGLRAGRLYKDVMLIKSLINVEKKSKEDAYSREVSQVAVNATGADIFDITPTISQDNTASGRNGNSVKITGAYIQGQIYQQTNTHDACKIIMEIWKPRVREVVMSLGSTALQLYNDNVFSSVIDANSSRNQFYFKDYILVARRVINMPADAYSAQVGRHKNFTVPLKLNYHQRYDQSGSLMDGQMFVFLRADSGNKGATASTLPNIPHTAAQTGFRFLLNAKWYWTDN